jgi:hypothetical protein
MKFSIPNLIAAMSFGVLWTWRCYRLRDLRKGVTSGRIPLIQLRGGCLGWTWCFGLAAVYFFFITFTGHLLRPMDYAIAGCGGIAGLLYFVFAK